jgi:hypothetical protein
VPTDRFARIVGSLKGINEFKAEIVTLVRHTVSNAIRVTGDVPVI